MKKPNILVMVGPYRNLTTLIATALSASPDVLGLNHGYRRLVSEGVDFWNQRSSASLDDFETYVRAHANQGLAGEYGGSMRLSHVIRDGKHEPEVADSIDVVRPGATILLKESGLVGRDIKLARWTEWYADKGVRFLRPVRSPVDCVSSNLRTGHAVKSGYRGLPSGDAGPDLTGGSQPLPASEAEAFTEWLVRDLAWWASHTACVIRQSKLIDTFDNPDFMGITITDDVVKVIGRVHLSRAKRDAVVEGLVMSTLERLAEDQDPSINWAAGTLLVEEECTRK